MATDKINELFDQKTVEQLTVINQKLITTLETMDKLATASGKLSQSMTGKGYKESAEAAEKLAKIQRENELQAKKLEAMEFKLEQTKQKAVASSTKLTQAEKDLQKFRSSQVGSINQLSSANLILEKRLKSVNLTTEEGVKKSERLRRAIDRNNIKIKENSSALTAQKMNIGNYGSALDIVKGKLNGFTGSLKKMLTAVALIAGVGKIFSSITGWFKGGISSAIKMEEATEKLSFSLGENSEATQRMLDFAGKMSKSSLFSKSAIMDAEQMALSLGRTEDQTKKMVIAAMGLSRVTGVDLNTAMQQLNMTYSGSVGRMAKYAPELKNLTAEQLKSGKAVDILSEKMGKFATSGLDTTAGKTIMAEKAWKGLWRTMAEGSTGTIGKLTDAFTGVVKSVTKWFEIPVSKKMEDERIKVNHLANSLTNVNIPMSIRNKNYETLKKIAPDVVNGINMENISTARLNMNLQAYNQLQSKKIALKVREEHYAKVQEQEAKAYDKLSDRLEDFDKMIENIKTGISMNVPDNLFESTAKEIGRLDSLYNRGKITAFEYFESLKEVSKKAGSYNGLNFHEYRKTLNNVIDAQDAYNIAVGNTAKEYEKVKKVEDQLNQGAPIITPPADIPSTGSGTTTPKTAKEKADEQKKIDEDLLKSKLEVIKQEQESLKKIAEDETKTADERIKAIDNLLIKKDEASTLQLEFDQKYSESETDLKNKEIIYINEGVQNFNEAEQKKTAILIKAKEEEIEALKNANERENELLKLSYSNKLSLINKERTDKITALYQMGLSEKEFAKKRDEIEFETAQKINAINQGQIQQQIDALKNSVIITEEEKSKLIELETNLSNLQMESASTVAEHKKALDEEEKARLKEKYEAQIAYTEKIQEGMTIVSDVGNALFDRETELRNRKMAGLDQESMAYKKLAREQAESARKQAIFQRIIDSGQIIANTAKGVMSVLSTGGGTAYADFGISAGLLSAFVIAQGATQLASLLANPLPEVPGFWKGTESSPKGTAELGERGRELFVTPAGEVMLANKRMFVDLEKGTKVFNNQKTEQILKDIDNTGKVGNSSGKMEYILGELLILTKKNSKKQINNNIFVNVKSQSKYKYYQA